MTVITHAPKWRIWAAFAAIYLIWGSSYIAIHFAIQTLPPFVMAGSRFMAAGLLLILWARTHGAPAPTRQEWRSASIAGSMLFLLNNAAIVWSQQYVPSGMTALLIAATPMWMVLFDWWRPGGSRPHPMVFVGLAVGFVGITLLISPSDFVSSSDQLLLGSLVILVGTTAWAAGSTYVSGAKLPQSPSLSTGMQLLTGGFMLFMLGVLTGDLSRLDLAHISPQSALAWLYLMFFPSITGFSCYVWLLRVSTAARVSTYAYVNPVVAVFLGWLLANEEITPRTLIAAAVIIGSVMLINTARTRKRVQPSVSVEADLVVSHPLPAKPR